MQPVKVQTDVTPQQLQRYAALVYDKIGISISPQKITLLSNRLRRCLRATGVDSYDDYYDRLCNSSVSGPDWERFLQEVTTHETYLFRDQKNWDWLCNSFVPELVRESTGGKRRKSVRVWSAACSTGDEAYTIAACLADRLPSLADWEVSILGTDVGADAVAQASNPQFSERAMRLVPETYRRRFFEKSAGANVWMPKPVLREMTRFETHNLLMPLKQSPFDLIVLKNVLIYFDAASKKKVVEQVRRLMRPGSVLISGAAEGVTELLKGLDSIHGWLHCSPRSASAKH